MNGLLALSESIATRRSLSTEMVEQFRASLRMQFSDSPELASLTDGLTIFATGSVGRMEAGPGSDLDLFMIHVGDHVGDNHPGYPTLQEISLFSILIQANKALMLPELDADGEFLRIHPHTELREFLGTPNDEPRNVFTARMLLLLESKPLWNDAIYGTAVDYVIDEIYTRDEPRMHPKFRPYFVINDLVRYWKTLCLVYERERLRSGDDNRKARHAHAKLLFSRAWMVFNGAAFILADLDHKTVADQLRAMVGTAPVDRMAQIAAAYPGHLEAVQGIVNDYTWFLETVSVQQKAEAREWMGDDENWEQCRTRGKSFCDALGALVWDLARERGISRQLFM